MNLERVQQVRRSGETLIWAGERKDMDGGEQLQCIINIYEIARELT